MNAPGRLQTLFVAAALCSPAATRAQEPADEPVAPPDEATLGVLVAPRERLAPSFDGSWAWTDRGPRGALAWRAILRATDGDLLAVDGDGAVWRADAEARGWRRRLGGVSGLGGASLDEAALLDAEVRLDEILGGLDLSEPGLEDEDEETFEEALDALDDASDAATQAAVEELQGDALQTGFFGQVQASASGPVIPPRLVRDGETLLLTRVDGLWVGDADDRWRVVWNQPVRDVAPAPWGGWVVAGERGLLTTTDLSTFEPIGPPGWVASDLAVVEGALVAAGPGGLVASDDGADWGAWGTPRPALRVVDAPGDAGTWFLSDDEALRRTRDGGQQYVVPVGPPVPRVRGLDRVGDLLVLAAGDGVWTSTDGGASVRRMGRGWPGGDAWDALVDDDGVWIAGDAGLLHLEPVDLSQVAVVVDDAFPELGLLLAAAEARVGQRQSTRLGVGAQALLWALPQVAFDARFLDASDLRSDLGAGRDLIVQRDTTLLLTFTWTPPGRNLSVGSGQQVVVQDTDQGPRFYSGSFDQWMMLGSVRRRAADTRARATEQIVAFHQDRAWLVASRQQRGEAEDLRDAVGLRLRIAELEAWMDALTDGAVARWRAAQALEEDS